MTRALTVAAVISVVTFSLAPFVWSVITSLKTSQEVLSVPPTWLPRKVSLENYTGVFRQRPFGRYILNSVIVGLGATAMTLLAASLAAYALTRLNLRGAAAIEKALLLFALFPHAMLLVPLFSLVRSLGGTNSYFALMVIHAAVNLPFAVWVLTSFFRQLPRDLEDAARVDGFSRLGTLLKVILPLSAPALASTAILVFIFSWNEYVFGLALMTRDQMRTVPVGISMISGASSYDIPWGQISAAVVVTTLPVVLAVLALQRWIISGLTAGAVKG